MALRLEVWAAGIHCVGGAEVLASLFGFPCSEGFSVGHPGMAGAELLEGFVGGTNQILRPPKMKETHWFPVSFFLNICGKTGSLAHLKIL